MRAFGRDTTLGDLTEVTQVLRTPDRVDLSDSEATLVTRSSPFYQQRPGHVRDLFQPVDKSVGEPASTHLDDPFTKPSQTSAPPWAEASVAIAKRSPSPQLIGIVVLAIVMLGLVGAAVAYFLTSGSPDQTGGAAFQPTKAARDLPAPPAALPAPVDTAHALIEPPGQARGGGGPFDLSQLESEHLVLPRIFNALQAGGMTDGVLKTTTTAGDTTIGMFAFTMPDQKAAITVARAIAAAQYAGGLLADNERALQGVTVLGSAPGPPSTVYYRAVYVLYNRTIYFEVFGPNRDTVLATVDFLINQQVTYAPPTVSGG